jgi:hypothetical protein
MIFGVCSALLRQEAAPRTNHNGGFGEVTGAKNGVWYSRHSRSRIARSTVTAAVEFNWRVLMWSLG